MITRLSAYIYSIFALFILFNCTANAATNISSDIYIDQTWELSGSPYIITKSITLEANLTIKPGVTVRFARGADFIVKGKVSAIGTESSKITFMADTSVPVRPFWGAIKINYNGQSDLSKFIYCEFQSGGYGYVPPLIINTQTSPYLRNLSFSNNFFNGITFGFSDFTASTIMYNCGAPYILMMSKSVNEKATLSIEAGTVIKSLQRVILDIRGDLVANGTHQSPITITALKDDDADGVDADGVGYTVPNSGDWGGLYYYSSINSNKSILKNVRIRYGGGSDITLQSNIVLKGANLRIEYCKFEKSTKTALACLDYASPDLGGGALKSVGFNMFDGFDAPGYAIANYGYSTIYALNNCWGSADSATIARQFFTKSSGVLFYPFNVDCKLNSPDAPALVYPANHEKGISKSFAFLWNRVPAANDYQFQMALDKQFNSIYLKKTQIDTSMNVSGLKYNTDYYWRVKSANLTGESEWSECYTFRVMDSVKPAIPEPISPIAMKFSNCNTDFSWKKVNNADKYHIQISQTQDFSVREIDDSTLALNSTNYSTLTRSKIYYWRVRSSNIQGKSEWSEVMWFITDDLFAAKTILKLNGKASNFKSVDLNGNGYQDIVYIKDFNTDRNLFIADNIGGLTFIEKVLQPSTKATNYFFVDLNNDNLLDIIIEEYSNNKYIYSSYQYINEKLTLLEANFLSLDKQLRKVIGSDLDNDGKNEFAFLFGDDKKGIALFEFQSSKLVQKLKLIDVAIADIASFDFNRDGYRDIAALQGDSLLVFFNKINSFTKKSFKLSSAADSLIVYDYNQDKYSDLIAICANNAQFFKNNLNDFTKDFSFDEKNLDMVSIFDLNNDNNLDFVYSISNNNKLLSKSIDIIRNNTSFADTLSENYSVLLYGAFDADNEQDFIAYNGNENSIVALKNMTCKANSTVYPPINLRYVFSNGKIVFEWDKNPLNSPNKNITYSIAVGSDVIDYDVIVPGSDYNRLRLMNDNTGNCGYANFFITSGIPSGRYYWQVQSIDENGTASQFSSIDEVKSQDIANLPPQDWMKVPCTGKNSTIILPYLNNLMINGRRLRDGDALGVFYTKDSSLVCGGYGVWRDGRNTAFTVWGDDQSTKEKDGFDNSENYRFIFWDVVKQQTYPVAARYESGAPWFLPDTVTTIASFGRFDSLVVELKANTWNFVSSNVAPHNPSFDNFLPEQVKQVTDDEGNQKVPGQNDDLQYWDVLTAYNVYATEDTKLKIVGVKIKPEQAEIVIPGNKITYITYLPDSSYSFSSAFANIYSNILICKDEMGRINMPDYSHIEFGTIYPTKGYKIMLKTSDTLIYPYYGNKANQTNVSAPTHFVPAYYRTGSDATIVMKFDKATDGDEIGVYSAYNRLLCGSGVIKNNHAYITVWGDNPLTDKVVEGAKENEELYAKYFSKKDNTEYYAPIEKAKLFVDNSLINVATYISDGAYIYESKKELLTAISEDVEIPNTSISVYPNPFTQNITVEKKADDIAAIYSLIDSQGRQVGAISSNTNSTVEYDTSKLAPGAYYVVVENQGKKEIKKVVKLK